jgi:hypothetical protein
MITSRKNKIKLGKISQRLVNTFFPSRNGIHAMYDDLEDRIGIYASIFQWNISIMHLQEVMLITYLE